MAESLGMYYYGVGIDLSEMNSGVTKATELLRNSANTMQQSLQTAVNKSGVIYD
jgi:hypothetical protein